MSNKSQKSKVKSQKTISFEDQLTASARRLREAQDANLHVPASPQSHRRQYWGWIATPAAAAVGVLIGLFINQPSKAPNQFTVPVVAAETTGHSILDDGADYSLFVSM